MFLTTSLATLWLVSITIFTPTQAGSFTQFCDDQPTSAVNYIREVMGSADFFIQDMDVSRHTGNIYIVALFFQMQVIYKGEQTPTPLYIEDTEIVHATAVDKRVPKVYIGTEHGLKSYNELTADIENIPHITNAIYLIYLPENTEHIYLKHDSQIYRYHNITSVGESLNITLPHENVKRFVVDYDENYYYTTIEHDVAVSYVLLKGASDKIVYNGSLFMFDVDNAGRVYYISDSKLYHMEAGGTKSQLIMTMDFYPWHLRFDKDNNIIIGSFDNIFIYNSQYNCVPQPTQAITNISVVQNNITKGFDDIKRELDRTNFDNLDLHNSVISEIKSVKKSIEEASKMYNDKMLEMKKEIIDLLFNKIQSNNTK